MVQERAVDDAAVMLRVNVDSGQFEHGHKFKGHQPAAAITRVLVFDRVEMFQTQSLPLILFAFNVIHCTVIGVVLVWIVVDFCPF